MRDIKHFVIPYGRNNWNYHAPICNNFATLKEEKKTSDIAKVTCKTCLQIIHNITEDGVSILDPATEGILRVPNSKYVVCLAEVKTCPEV